ncbi:MAG TPA: HlyD family efflux transporter periplasmic adaptor subunit [Acidimicrobiales bacterium]|nr:HlyD family efflux transporter periplasmic adaptor subunit [Acidimicrobiales bacterium]
MRTESVGTTASESQSAASALRTDEVTAEVPIVEGEAGGVPRTPFRRRNIIVAAVVVVVAAGAGIGIWLGTSSSAAPGLQITTQTVSVTSGTMQQTVATSGTIAPAQQANLNFGVSGTVTGVNVSAGQTVTAGQILASVDPSALQATANSAQASLTAAQAKLASDQAANASSSQITSDQASVTSAQSQLTTAQTNLTNASLTSTITGTVASVDLSVGQQVSSSSNSSGSGSASTGASGTGSTGASGGGLGGGLASSSAASSSSSSSSSSSTSSTGQIVVISTNSFIVNATVDDTQVGQVKQGDQVVITPSGSTTNVYGTVSSVGLIATSSSTVATFPVSIAVTGSPTGIYAGSTATLSIVVEQLNNAIQVPTAAISYSGGQSTVTVVQNGNHVSRAITTGVSSAGETQVTSGLTSGEKVLEQVVKFNGAAGGAGRNLFGGGTTGAGGAGGGRFRGGAGGAGGFGGAGGGGFGG